MKEANLLGNSYEYAVYEAEFDQGTSLYCEIAFIGGPLTAFPDACLCLTFPSPELFLVSDFSCPCVSSTQTCPISFSDVAQPVDESNLNITVLHEGILTYGSSTGETVYYKFEVPVDATVPCPVVRLDAQTQVGAMSVFISPGEIPTATSTTWTVPYNGKDHTIFCPFSPLVVYGTYYVAMISQITSAYNSWGLRISITNADTCPTNATAPPDTSSDWIQSGQAVSLTMAPLAVNYYRVYYELPADKSAAGERCFSFSASIMGTQTGTNGDIFASLTQSKPSASTNPEWIAATDVDDSLTAYICLPPGNDTIVIYVGVYNRATSAYPYLLTVTTREEISKVALDQLLYSQSSFSLNYGATPKLICNTSSQPIVFNCRAPPSETCSSSGSGCCYLFRNLAPTAEPNPLMPWNAFDTSIPEIWLIPWNDAGALVSGKLVWSLYRSISDPTSGEEYAVLDPGNCYVELGDLLVNSANEKLTGNITFKPKVANCDATNYNAKVKAIRQTVDDMSTMTEYYSLALSQLRLNLLSMSDELLGCDPLFKELTAQANTTREFETLAACFSDVGSAAWGSDPCCNRTLALSSCCAAARVNVTFSSFATPTDDSATTRLCANPACAARAVETFISSEASIQNLQNGCASQFQASASVALKASLEAAASVCLSRLLTPELRGLPCTNDTDCNGVTCMPLTMRCNHSLDDVTACIANSIDPTVARALYNAWGNTTTPVFANNTIELIRENAYATECSGIEAIRYLTAYHYRTLSANCVDNCAEEPVCIDSSCIVDDQCNSTVTAGACSRYWVLVDADNAGCLNHTECNWMTCATGQSADDCRAACLDSSLSASTCVNCTGDHCVEAPGFNQTRCAAGYCTLDITLSTAECLAAAGQCSVTCTGCETDETVCVNHGSCSDADSLGPILATLNRTDGACVIPFTFNADGAYCADNTTLQIPSGCVSSVLSTEEECANASSSYIWEVLATTEAECIAIGTYCRNGKVALDLDADACSLCTTATVASYYTWKGGKWTTARMQQLQWVERQWFNPLTLADGLNVALLQDDIGAAVADVLTFPFITEALCRYTTSYSVAGSLVCDCTSSDNSNCFSSISNQRVGANRACAGIESSVNTRVATLQVFKSSYPAGSSCQLVEIYSTAASEYELDESHSLSSAIFQSSPTNSFWVVERHGLKDVAIGQIVSGAVNVSLGSVKLSDSVWLCIYIEDDIDIAENVAKTWSMAELEDGTVTAFYPSPTINVTENAVCDFVNKSGSYFATKLVFDYQNEEEDSVSNRRQARAGAVLYFATVLFACVQGTVLIINWQKEKIVRLKIVFVVLVGLNALVRGIYMLVPASSFTGNESIQFIIFELPSFLFFSVFLSIIYLWVNVTLKASQWRKRKGFLGDAETVSRNLFIVANIVLYAIFIVFMFLISILPSIEKASVCFLGAQNNSIRNSSFYRTKLAYWVIVSALCVIISVGFLIGAASLLKLVLSVERTGVNKHSQGGHRSRRMNKLILITIVAVVCTVFLLIRSGLFLYTAITSKSINTILFVLLEVVPSCGLLYYLRPYFLISMFKSSKTSSRSSADSATGNSATPRTATRSGRSRSARSSSSKNHSNTS